MGKKMEKIVAWVKQKEIEFCNDIREYADLNVFKSLECVVYGQLKIIDVYSYSSFLNIFLEPNKALLDLSVMWGLKKAFTLSLPG